MSTVEKAHDRTVQASCHCAGASFPLTLPAPSFPLNVSICHCNSCRHMTGLLCGSTLAYLPSTYIPDQVLLKNLTSYNFSDAIKHWFCPTCGTSVLGSVDLPEGDRRWLVSVGSLREGDASVYVIKNHFFLQDTLDGGFSNFLLDFQGTPIKRYARLTDSEELPRNWNAESRSRPRPPAAAEKLYGYCHCKGVEFYLAAPSGRSIAADEGYENDQKGGEKNFWLRDGATRFRAANCPCHSCRLAANGQLLAQWAYVPTTDVSLDATGHTSMPMELNWGTLKTYRTSERATQHFCSRCGAVVFWNTDARPYLKDFGIGLFESPCGARAESWFRWKSNALRFREDGLERSREFTLALESGLSEYRNSIQKSIPGHAVGEAEGNR